MICPRCHNENRYDALTCDFCMGKLPMTKERQAEIQTYAYPLRLQGGIWFQAQALR